MPPSPVQRMASKQAAAKRAPAKSRNTGKRKAAKPAAVVTSTPLRRGPRPRPIPIPKPSKAVPNGAEPAEDDDALVDIFEEGNVSLFDVADQVEEDDLSIDHEVFDEVDSILNDDEKEEETDGDVDTRQFFQISSLFHSFHCSTGPVIDIAFKVPYKNAFRDLAIKSDISFTSFLTCVAEKMESSIIHRSSIGYILPWKVPRTGKPIAKLLEDEEAFRILINNIWQYIDEQKAKNKGKGKVKPFSIQVVDMADTDDKVRFLSDHSRNVLNTETGYSWKEKDFWKTCC